MVVFDLNELGEIILDMGIQGGLEVIQIIFEGMGGDTISGGYITIFHDLEVDINDGVTELDEVGIKGVLLWIHCCN